MQLSKKSVLLVSLGSMLGYYDSVIYTTFLPIISPLFFPSNSQYQSIVNGFYVLFISSIATPIGEVFFGFVADTYGRKLALLISIFGMAITSIGMSCLLPYSMIGAWATTIIILFRIVQNMCFAGEGKNSGIYVVEVANGYKEGANNGLLGAITVFGGIIAPLVALILTLIDKDNPNWRVAFILGGIAGLIVMLYRNKILEFTNISTTGSKIPVTKIVKIFKRHLFVAASVGGFFTVPFVTIVVFINPVLVTTGNLTNLEFMLLKLVLTVFNILTLLLSGVIADKYTPKLVMRIASCALTILAIPISVMINTQHIWLTIIAEIVLSIISGLFCGPGSAYLKSLFPSEYRCRAIAISVGIMGSLTTGLTPIVENFLYSHYGFSLISLWLMLVGSITFFAMGMLKEYEYNYEIK